MQVNDLLRNWDSLLVLFLGIFFVYFIGLSTYSFFLTLLVIPFVLSTINTQTSRKIRSKIRDVEEEEFLQAEFSPESTEWINTLLHKIWVNNRWFIAKMIKEKVEPIIKQQKPFLIKDISIHSIDLGVKTPQLSNFCVHRIDENNKITFDCDFFYDGDLKIAVTLDMMISTDIIITHPEVFAKARITATLLPNTPPFASIIHIQLREQPDIDIEIKPLGGVGFDVTNTIGIKSIIDAAIATTVKKMLLAPRYTEIDLVKIMKGEEGAVTEKEAEDGLIGSIGGGITRGVGAVGNVGVGAVKGLGKGVTNIGNFGMTSMKKGFGISSKKKATEDAPQVPLDEIAADPPATSP